MFNIYVDNREQKPLKLKHKFMEHQIPTTLPYGDYACKVNGYRIPYVFERKSFGDLFGTLGKGMKRFLRELERAKSDSVKIIIIIEVRLGEIIKGYKYSQLNGLSVLRTLFTLQAKHNTDFIFVNNRREMGIYITEFFYSQAKQYRKELSGKS